MIPEKGKERFSKARRLFGGIFARNRIVMLLAIIGPGIITSNVDNDPGGVTVYSLCGARFGYRLMWIMIPMMISLGIIQEMCVRMGIVTGKGLADLIRENFGIKSTFYVLLALLVTNIFNTVSEFAGVAAAGEILGVSRYIMLPLAIAFIGFLIFKGTYRTVEKIFLVACLFYISYVISAFMAKPDWGEIGRSLFVPHMELSVEFMVMAMGMIGTTIAPWMQFYLQASIVEKNIKKEELFYSRIDVIVGSVIAVVVAGFIVATCGATLHPAGIRIESAGEAALALAPLAGKYAATLFAVGLLVAGLFSAEILPLSTAYHVCEGMGWPAGINYKYEEARNFYWLYAIIMLCGALPILLPQSPLIMIMYFSQVSNTILLPFVLIMMLKLINNKDLMGEYTNGLLLNIISYGTVIILIALTVGSMILPLLKK